MIFKEVLYPLIDGNWHTNNDVINKFRASKEMMEEVLNFLAKYEFVIFDMEEGRIKIDPDCQKLLLALQQE